MREYLLADPNVDLSQLDWKSIRASRAAYHIFYSLGQDKTPNALMLFLSFFAILRF